MNIACKIREFLGVLGSWQYLLVPQPQLHHSKRYIDRPRVPTGAVDIRRTFGL